MKIGQNLENSIIFANHCPDWPELEPPLLDESPWPWLPLSPPLGGPPDGGAPPGPPVQFIKRNRKIRKRKKYEI